MTVKARIFVSAVTAEFGGARRKVANILRRLGYEPELQDIFGTESGDLRQMLREKIDSCGGLIQIVGDAYGAEPPVEDDDFGRVSYTQFEFFYATAQSKETWLIVAGYGCTRDKSPYLLDLPADPLESDREHYQNERRELQRAYRERIKSSGHLSHEVEDDKDLEIRVRDLRDEFAVLRKSFRRWQRSVVTAIVAILLVLGVVVVGVYWTVLYQPEEVARHLADPEIIRVKLRETIEATFERDRKQAEQLDDWQDRERAVRLAREARDRRLADVDEFIESVTRTISEGDASPEYIELNRILHEQGIDAALAYVDSQWVRLLADVEPEVADIERSKRDVRRKLMPGLESVRLMRARGRNDAALLRCGQLLASDATWPEACHEYVWIRIDLGDQAELYGTINQALEHFHSARDSAQFLHHADRGNATAERDLSVSYERLGDASAQAGDLDQARDYFLKCHEILEKLATDDPSNATSQRDLSVSYNKLGAASAQAGDLDQAHEYGLKCHEILKKLATDDPRNATAQRDLSLSYNNLGDASEKAGDLDRAREYFLESLAIAEKLAADDPSNATAQRDLSLSYERLGDASEEAGDLDQARKYFLKCLDLRKRLAADDPSNATAQRDLSVTYNKLGAASEQAGHLDQAREYFLKSLAISENLAADDPSNATAQRDVSVSYNKLGAARAQAGDLDQAREYFLKSLAIAEKLVADDPSNATAQHDLMASHYNLGLLAKADTDFPSAIRQFEAGANVLRRMIADGKLAAPSQKELEKLEQEIETCLRLLTAGGSEEE